MNTRKSPGYKLVEQVWEHLKARSWIRTNHSLQAAIHLAIDACMDFSALDMSNIHSRMQGGYWLHHEQLYTRAVKADNLSACKSLEHAMKRRPWILGGQRLTVGATTPWGVVTSMTDEKLIACEYDALPPIKPSSTRSVCSFTTTPKLRKRNNVTREMVAAENSQERAASKATVTCHHCKHIQPDHRTGSAWVKAGKRPRAPKDRCQCGEQLPKIRETMP
jgi:hypothetical protein